LCDEGTVADGPGEHEISETAAMMETAMEIMAMFFLIMVL
jgi:hypothetical protein